MKAWAAEQLRSFITHVSEHRMYAAVPDGGHYGMRRGEIAGLKWADIANDVERDGCDGGSTPSDPVGSGIPHRAFACRSRHCAEAAHPSSADRDAFARTCSC